MGSFKFDEYFEDKAYFNKFGPLTLDEETLAINLMNGAQLLIEKCQWHINDYNMEELYDTFLKVVRKCDHTQFIYLMKVLPPTFVLSYSLTKGYLPPEQTFTYSTCLVMYKDDFIRIMDFVYRKIDMGINFQRDLFLKWYFNPTDIFNVDSVGVKYPTEYWDLICVGIAMYFYNEQFNTPVGCMWKTLLFMEEVSTVLLTEINESLGIETNDGDGFLNYKMDLQEEMMEKARICDLNGEGTNNFSIDYDYSFEYKGMEHIYVDRKPLYEETILRFSLWVKIIFNVLKYFEVFPKDSTDRDSDDKVVVRNNFIRQNEEELKKAFYRIVIPVIKVAYRIGHYGTSIKLCEMILRLADKKDFYDSKPINVSDEIKDKIIEILPWMIRSYYKTSCGQSLKGIKKYFEETFCIYNLYWIEDLEDIIQGNLEKGLSSLNTKKNLFFQNHIDEICSEVASILNYYKDEKSFEKNKDDSSEISNDRKGNNYLNKGKKKKKRKIINSDRIIDSLNSWDSIPKEPLEKYSIIYDSKRFTDFIEGNVLATYECFVDLRNVALKKYNKILWQSSELLQTIGRFSLTQQSNAKSFLSSYCSYLITEDVKKRLTLRLNKVQFSEDIELPLKLVNSKILDECLSSSPIECIEIGKKVSWWLNHCGHYVHAKLASKFYLDTAHLAIKSGNENLAKDQLYHYKKAISKISKYDYPLENLYGNILSIDYDIRFKDRDVTFKHIGLMGKAISTFGEQFFEKNQLSRVIPTNVEVIENEISNINVIATNKINIDYYKKQIEREIELKGLSKAILRMGILIMENNENLQKYTECLSDPTQGSFINKLIKPYVRQFHSTIEFSDMATSVVFPSFATLASKFSPKYLKPYLMLGDYAFIKGSKNSSDYLPVTEMEEKQIKNHLSNIKKYFNDEEFKKLCLIVLSTNTISSLRNNLVNFIKQCPLYRGEAEVLSDIVMNDIPFTSLFTKILNRQSKFFTISTKAYEQYLSLVDSPHSSSEITKAVLRIYKMIVLCPQVLSRLICSIIKKVNEDVWKNILPQLIPRFSHPNRFVRETIYNILESVAKTSPHVLVFPIVVAKNNVRDEDMYFNTMNKAKFDSLKSMAKEKEKVFIAEYCTKLSNYIEEKHPGLIDSVSGFVDETKKINMLLDEKWIYVLSKCDSEMKKKYSSYCSYIKRGYDPRTSEAERIIIGKEKLKISSMMIYQALDDLYASTFNKSYECQYEKDFLASFEGIIKEAYEKYKSYKHDNDPMKAFLPFQELLKELVCLKNVRIQKMNLEDLNNKLYNMKGGIIPLPGQDKKRYNDPSFISIEKMSNNVIVIQSLTRPKKIEFYGNDGTSHCYLVKGYEDMHLDERLQQILRICNQILNNKKYKLSGDYDYSYEAKNYSVTPIGARSGLIKYVSEAVQMFTSYYSWLQKNKIKFEGEVSEEVNSIKKARHFFVGRVKRYLDINDNDKIIDINEYRTKENTRAFVRAFNEISDIVPKNIITNKIGKIIIDGDHWHHITKTYSRSVAVMSMIGWLFGLGDRHLSNIMIIYSTGEILHIDYNVCFGKFKNLKCPEKVPFRLTRNIVDVMGPLKTEGVFRESCKHVLKCLKEEHEILYNILETYAYDPLADWSSISEMKNQGEILPLDIMFAVYGRSVFEVKSFLERSFRLFKVRVMESSLMIRDFGKMICDAIENLNRMYKQENDSNGEYSQDKKEYDLECAKFNNAQKPLDNISNQIRSPLAKLSAYNNDFASLERLFFSELIPKVKKACMLIVPHEYNHNLNCERIKLLNEISELTKNSILYIKKLSAKDIVFNEENIYSLKRDSRHCDSSSQLKNEHAVSIINDVKSRFNKLFRENNDDVNKINNLTTPETSLEVERRIDTIVSNLINEATDVKNLSFMYEGWAAWV
uniref:Non-specific serine/threonine protein kinase n=1 Tax=Parastrongyloides trichosuri TaxID=131310 RepID=A0A0N4ZNJ7_PARTI